MCGIVGAIGLARRPAPAEERRILDRLSHRGPDAEGTRYQDGVWFGFRRLSILDLSSRADQPMVDGATGVSLVFNGEIYDYVERRAELRALGHSFVTSGDTEVVLKGYLEWGTSVFERLNGMFAVAVSDPRRGHVVLARDRFGEKPLHYGRRSDGSWWFASEPSVLRSAGVGSGRVDLDRVLGFLALGDVEDPTGSYFDGIVQLGPGMLATLDGTGIRTLRRWWSLDALLERSWDAGPATDEEVLATLDHAVSIRLRSDVTVGTSLSGGVDSAAVVSSMRAVDPDREIHSFTASFPGTSIDEWDRAASVGERHRLVMHRVEPTVEGFLADLDRIVDHQGGPIESPTVYAQWSVMRTAREAGVTVLLDGQGADETWGGYPKYVGFGVGDLSTRLELGQALRMTRRWRELGGLPHLALAQGAALTIPTSLRPLALRVQHRRFRANAGIALLDAHLEDPQGAPGGGRLLQRAARADLGRVVLPRLLRYADRNSMAWGREVRLPFLDPAMVELALRSGWVEGLTDGWTKLQLRRAVAPRLPEGLPWQREKIAYATPTSVWLEHPGSVEAVHDATDSLQNAGVLATDASGLDPWQLTSLARFMEQNGLTT